MTSRNQRKDQTVKKDRNASNALRRLSHKDRRQQRGYAMNSNDKILRVLRQFIRKQETKVAQAMNGDERAKQTAILADYKGALRMFLRSGSAGIDFADEFPIL
jgi:hypothetical protein